MSQALQLRWGLSFSSVSKVRFDQICIAQDFQARQGFLQCLRLWHGNLLPADIGDVEAVKAVNNVAGELIRRSAGLFSSFSAFLVLVFPAKKDEWKFLESTLDYPQDARLRYFIFWSNFNIRYSLKMNPITLAIDAPYRNILADRVHGLDYKQLLPIIRRQKAPVFFLLFPSTASQTADFIVSWLRSSSRSCKIYSSQSEDSWHYFIDNPEIRDGIILVRESAAAEPHRLPNLYSVVVKKNFTFWYLSESNSPYPLFPSTSYGFDNSTMGQLSAVRLFPHGCAFLLTPSFLLAEPHNAYQILKCSSTDPEGSQRSIWDPRRELGSLFAAMACPIIFLTLRSPKLTREKHLN
jgi:chromo domain-containing protein 1